MASKIQRLVSQARATFSKRGTEPAFSEEMKQLNEIVSDSYDAPALVQRE